MKERSDDRKQGERDIKIEFKTILYKYWKEVMAGIIFLFSVTVFVFSLMYIDEARTDKLETLLISVVASSIGYLFGRNTD